MSYYPNFGFGMLITEPEIIEAFVKKATLDYPDVDENPFAIWEVPGAAYFQEDDDYICDIVNVDGEYNATATELLVLYAERQPTPFKIQYNDIDEVIAEMKQKYGKYLPEDLDYRKHLGNFSAVSFG